MSTNINMDAFWMPYTANRDFKNEPRIIERAEGVMYYTNEGQEILDATAGLWCVNAGHGRTEIADAVSKQLCNLDYASPFNFGHEIGFEFANRLIKHTPASLNKVFFANSGSEAVESALKIALQYQKSRGKGGKTKFLGRELAYHGVNFGGISVGGLTPNRVGFGPLLPTDHLPHTLDIANNAFSKGLPEQGIDKAEALEQLINFHGAESIAAVIIEPMSGAGGVIMPPQGYLKRMRDICDQYDILLIFDEVITGWGRLGSAFASEEFDVVPDMITSAKGITNGAIPLGAVFVKDEIHDQIVNNVAVGGIEFYHGYTYSAHPVACAAGLATLDIYEKEGLLTRASGEIGTHFENALHSLKDAPKVIDVRNYGLVGAVQFDASVAANGPIGLDFQKGCYKRGVMVRTMGNIVAFSPPLTVEANHIDQLVNVLRETAEDMFA
ncbi:aminotransferase class III-fold pyridoxal phosphate-dependent enzyme [Amphritea sp. 2_MG-2023]|jgi:beta-alanine--pyruvate transaminase|uniref:aminotransferase class III-fold pyridoxal phosphate-dependent enzyme n=1 Tax=Amphritea TaxID=515417 RepID=UPI001C06A164|nr:MULTISPECIES: aminotransferase class III-fold pyridoxal phosphate-dependent enzyme [Amphritea]MBU2965932.1 aminotransferase class III-fold pyridoxal phosphate-dependent enzyme [Amphritea atlantica]MDO6418022.1 aminotransferase class III-fold pyridoxal phosphate-dependent enzyme [Amphritea sp. 2_MG-2023]MDX2422407.1 aminotransferase class III-fold pyridoxal phosphate-dependent enzyme [Amphritea sp.]